MDLDSRNHRDIAYSFLSSYLECSGDYEGLRLLRYYLIYRSLVRAKVAAIGKDVLKMELHIELALRYVEESTTAPKLILMNGLSGTGKSYVSACLVSLIPGIRLRSDVERKRLAGLKRNESSHGTIYTKEMNDKVHKRLLECCKNVLQTNICAIVDATMLKKELRLEFQAISKRCFVVTCAADYDVMVKRLKERKGDPSEATEEVVKMQIEKQESICEEEEEHYVLNTSKSVSYEGKIRHLYYCFELKLCLQ